MPNYAFSCTKCSKTFDLFLKIDERDTLSAKRVCPFCQSPEVSRLITPTGGILTAKTIPAACGPTQCSGCCHNSGCHFDD